MSTSVVKDLVVLLDSGQQDNATFESAKNVIIELLDTFTTADYVNVVTIDAMRATLLQPTSVLSRSSSSCGYLINVVKP